MLFSYLATTQIQTVTNEPTNVGIIQLLQQRHGANIIYLCLLHTIKWISENTQNKIIMVQTIFFSFNLIPL